MNSLGGARKIRPTGRRPKTVDGVRVCAMEQCDTRLSRYNRKRTCHVHTPVRYPRIRGRVSPA